MPLQKKSSEDFWRPGPLASHNPTGDWRAREHQTTLRPHPWANLRWQYTIKSEMLNYSSTHLNGATIDMHMPYALFQYCISCILEIANHHAFTCESSRPKWDQHGSTPLTQCGVVQVFGAFHLQAQASCKAPLGRGTCGTKENNHDAKGPKGADPARTGPGERVPSASVSCHFTDRG